MLAFYTQWIQTIYALLRTTVTVGYTHTFGAGYSKCYTEIWSNFSIMWDCSLLTGTYLLAVLGILFAPESSLLNGYEICVPAGPATMVRPVRAIAVPVFEGENGVAWILSYACVIELRAVKDWNFFAHARRLSKLS